MKPSCYKITASLLVALLCLCLAACGGSPFRFAPGPPAMPVGLTVTAGNGQAALSWGASGNAAAYNIYYSSSPQVNKVSAFKIATISGSSFIVTGLTNGVTYWFAVAAVNSSGESSLSSEVSVTPVASGSFSPMDLQGSWRFNALISGASACWMRGSAAIDVAGNVSVTSFVDSLGNSTAPAGIFSTMSIAADGTVSQSASASNFHGILSAGQYKDLMVATASLADASRLLIIFQKQVPGIVYSSSDIHGTGRLVAGPLPFVYHQLASGASSGWETASGQIGQDQSLSYVAISAPEPRQLPGQGNKVTNLTITPDGVVTETQLAGVTPLPTALLTSGIMSADKMTIIGTTTAANGAYVLRIMQFVHPPSVNLGGDSYTLAGLAGSFTCQSLFSGAAPKWANGTFTVNQAAVASYDTYLDSSGNSLLPGAVTLSLDQQGGVTAAADPSYSGQLAYFRDMLVITGTESPGSYHLSIALRR